MSKDLHPPKPGEIKEGASSYPDGDVPAAESDPADQHEEHAGGPLTRGAFLIGSAGLLAATATDALAVLGRHAGFTLLGSIELVQFAIVLVASSAMVGATLQSAHASVHLLTQRLRPETADRLARVMAVLSALLFVIIALGSIWVASDLWSGFERTELLGLPLRWFRLLFIAATLLIALLFLRQAFARTPVRPRP